ncbi:MAG: DUF1800 domain-containing protein [Bacteroidota bacterium]
MSLSDTTPPTRLAGYDLDPTVFRPETDWTTPQTPFEGRLLRQAEQARARAKPRAASLASAPPAPAVTHTSLTPAQRVLSQAEAHHLLRRIQHNAPPGAVAALTGQPIETVVGSLVAEAVALDPVPEPDWIDTPIPSRNDAEAFQAFIENNTLWLTETRYNAWTWLLSRGLRERMTLFWHDHFATEAQIYQLASFAFRYLALLREHAFGNFQTFVHAVGTDAAMLLYLNGNQNERSAPNENYARELLELFTMGPTRPDGTPNYTDVGEVPSGQSDVEMVARALTGWVIDGTTLDVLFLPFRHDDGPKTIFGQTGPYGYDEVIDLLFRERTEAIAYFICAKLYQDLVYETVNEEVVEAMAALFIERGFEIRPVVEALLMSEHFYDPALIGAQIKSPTDVLVGFLRETGTEAPLEIQRILTFGGFLLDQNLLDPPNVAGWPGYRDWVDTSTLPLRWLLTEYLLFGAEVMPPLDLVPMALDLHDPAQPGAVFYLAEAMATHLLAVPLDTVQLEVSDEPFTGNLVDNPIPDDILQGPPHRLALTKVMLAGVPWYEWDLSIALANNYLLLFTRYLIQLPEYQLG